MRRQSLIAALDRDGAGSYRAHDSRLAAVSHSPRPSIGMVQVTQPLAGLDPDRQDASARKSIRPGSVYVEQVQSTIATLGCAAPVSEPPEPVRTGLLAVFRAWRNSRPVKPE
jgi:hypothetical protein